MKRIITTLFAFSFCVLTSFGQTNKENDIIQRIDSYLTGLEEAGFDGSVLVELNGEKKISKGFGYSDKEKQIKNSPNTILENPFINNMIKNLEE